MQSSVMEYRREFRFLRWIREEMKIGLFVRKGY